MLNKITSSLIIISLLHANTAFCMEPDKEDKSYPRRLSKKSLKSSEIQPDWTSTPLFIKLANEALSKEKRITALKAFLKEHLVSYDLDEYTQKKINIITHSFLDDETLPLRERVELLRYAQEPSTETLLKLLETIETNYARKGIGLEEKLEHVNHFLGYSDPRVHQKIEDFFSAHPDDFMRDFQRRGWLEVRFKRSEEPLKNFILQKYCDRTQFSPNSNEVDLCAAKFVYKRSSNKKFISIVSENLLFFIKNANRELYELKSEACSLMLEYSQDSQVKDLTTKWLFNQLMSSDNFNEKASYVRLLLRKEDSKLREETLLSCEKILKTVIPEDLQHQKILGGLFFVLRQIEGTSRLRNMILDLLRPVLMNILFSPKVIYKYKSSLLNEEDSSSHSSLSEEDSSSSSDDSDSSSSSDDSDSSSSSDDSDSSSSSDDSDSSSSSDDSDSSSSSDDSDTSSSDSSSSSADHQNVLFEIFLLSPDENDRQLVYNQLKKRIIHKKDSADTAMLVVECFEESHPWVQEVIQLMVNRVHLENSDDSDDSDNPFVTHRKLLDKIKDGAVHHPSKATLDDGRIVRFNLQALQARRKGVELPPIEYSELIRLTRKLKDELEKNPSKLSQFMGKWENNFLLRTAENPFLKDLLSNNSYTNAGTSFKLRYLLMMAKKAESSSNASVPESDTGLSYTSNIILQLLKNVTTCNTGIEGGIDTAYRLITGESIVSEETMQDERLQEKAHRVITQELIKIREGLLNGDGFVARHFLDLELSLDQRKPLLHELKPIEDFEGVRHRTKYLKNLLGSQIGIFFEGEQVSFDQDGYIVDDKLKEAPLQEVLNVFHSYYRPEKIIEYFLEKFNKRELPEAFISSLIKPKDLFDNKYAFYLNDDPSDDFIRWKPLVVAELLLRLGILEEVPKTL